MKLLHIDTSILGGRSVSRELSRLIVDKFADTRGLEVVYRDLTLHDVPHLTLATLPTAHPASAMAGPLDTAAQALRIASDQMLQEFLDADTVVIGAGMYNFTIPTQLKAWIDRVVVPGSTFRAGPSGVVGLANGKRVIIALARGGLYEPETVTAAAEHAETLLRAIFGFIGIKAEFIIAEGINGGPENRSKALASAHAAITQLVA